MNIILLNRATGYFPTEHDSAIAARSVVISCICFTDCEGIVEDAIMLGAPVTGSTEDWSSLERVVSGRIVNGYCR